jgi:pyruvate/2-oxoglutarate dehydrogenase complex dihydrolipoamide dehydrogenase (E3) component
MNEFLEPDICVIGGGAAGLTVAAAAAALGVSVVLVEKAKMGGDCLNTGCVPSKALIAAARRATDIRTAPEFGITADDPRVNFPAVMAHVRGVIAGITPNDSAERFTGLGVIVRRGEAGFIDRRTVAVDNARIRARRFVIATGSRPAIPPIPGLSTVPYLTNETIFDLKRLPARLVVIGAGPVGLELAQAFRRLGSDVTVLEAERALANDDPELVALLLETLRSEGIDIREGVHVTRLTRRGRTAMRVTMEGESGPEILDATHLLIATGRRPDLESLGLKQARIAFDERGIKVNSRLRTRNHRVYAIGDVAAGPHFTHWANYQAGLVVRSILFRFGGKVSPEILPWITFTEPELAHVGIGEAEAPRRYRKISVLRWPLSENDRAQTDRTTRGLVKLIATKKGRIVGADILAHDAGELIAPLVLAVSQHMNVEALATAVFPYPTRSDAARRAAMSFYARKLDSPWLRRLVRLLRKLG